MGKLKWGKGDKVKRRHGEKVKRCQGQRVTIASPAAMVEIGVLRGRGIPFLENEKDSWFQIITGSPRHTHKVKFKKSNINPDYRVFLK